MPLDVRDPAAGTSFSTTIVSQLAFPAGTHEPADVLDAVRQHPVLRTEQPRGFVWDYQSWRQNGNRMDPQRATTVTFHYVGEPRQVTLSTLERYLGVSAPVTAAVRPHDDHYDRLTIRDFVDIGRTFDHLRLATAQLQALALRGFSSSLRPKERAEIAELSSIPSMSVGLAKWFNAAVQTALLEYLVPDEGTVAKARKAQLLKMVPELDTLPDDVQKIRRRMDVKYDKCADLQRPRRATDNVNLRDPNVAVQAAFKNALVARQCGFVSAWMAHPARPLVNSTDLVIELDPGSLSYDASIVRLTPMLATAFRRGTHTHVLSYHDAGSPQAKHGALVYLQDTDQRPRYRAVSVNSEREVAKQIILQAGNSLGGPANDKAEDFGRFNQPLDDRPPQLLAHDQFGFSELETSGVLFSAPIDDLIAPADLPRDPAIRASQLPCLFLEDLWVGYRLDLRDAGHPSFTSIHRQDQEISFKSGGAPIRGRTEDFVDREQPDDSARGHTSTELFLYNGFNTAQRADYLLLLGTPMPDVADPNQPFTVGVKSSEQSERLLFSHGYEYRLRTVLLGGVSCEPDDSNLQTERFAASYHQRFSFYRARALRAGELLRPVASGETAKDPDKHTIFLSSENPRIDVTLVPSPVDLDGSRFHGQLFVAENEIQRHAGRRHVADLGKLFASLPPRELNYFYDPDVHGIVFRLKLLNGGDALTDQFVFVDGAYCRVSRHLVLEPVTCEYGDPGDWERFQPIVVSFLTTNRDRPEMRRTGRSSVQVRVPPAGEVQLSMLPLVESDVLERTASNIASSAELAFKTKAGLRQVSVLVPTVAELLLTGIHAVRRPREQPRLFCDSPKTDVAVSRLDDSICLAVRDLDDEHADIIGRVEVDAASTKEIHLQASWRDIEDNPDHAQYALEPGNAATSARSVVFEPFRVQRPTAVTFDNLLRDITPSETSLSVAEQFATQCAEDKVFLGVSHDGLEKQQADKSNRLDLRDQRRKLLSVRAVAVSRFTNRFAGGEDSFERVSEPVSIDVPSTLQMTAPVAAHVVPLRRHQNAGSHQNGTELTTFGIRVYLRRRCFVSGPGERLAIGCAVGEGPQVAGADEVPKHITQWGEDPLERAGRHSTVRLPFASDFVSCHEEIDLPEELYPHGAVGGREPVIYRDNVRVLPLAPGGPERRLSVASFVQQYDARQRLWYSDLFVRGDFFGWCGLSLYRHQPHALPGRELSGAWEWVYAAILYGEPIAWIERRGRLHITIGPIYDATISFDLDSREARDVSIVEPTRMVRPLQRYRVGNAFYFEGIVANDEFDWSLLKKRFGHAIASRSIPLR
jgi:hypothetical protein